MFHLENPHFGMGTSRRVVLTRVFSDGFFPPKAHVEIISSRTKTRFELAIDVPWVSLVEFRVGCKLDGA